MTDDYGTVGGGRNNQAGNGDGDTENAQFATVGGGKNNEGSGPYAFVGGGQDNKATADYATVGGGRSNVASDSYATVSGGSDNSASAGLATVGGGQDNQATGQESVVAGGALNEASGYRSIVGGGSVNHATGDHSMVGGGRGHDASGEWSTVGGGNNNDATDDYGFIGGGGNNQAGSDDADPETATYATVGGGWDNIAEAFAATVPGGAHNRADGPGCTVGGGAQNTASVNLATVGGGTTNSAQAYASTVSGGEGNVAADWWSTATGGAFNQANGFGSAIGGGQDNQANGVYSTVPGGADNHADGDYSLAAGRRAKANDNGTFVWADSNDFDFPSTAPDEFSARATGGVRFVTAIDGSGGVTAGVALGPGDTAWSPLSDRDLKENFVPADGCEILDRLASIPIGVWNFKHQDSSLRHIGPVAQDFHAAFQVGRDDRHISTIDADGVALAAIQGLHQIVKEKDAEIKALRTEKDRQIADLEARLIALEQALARVPLAACPPVSSERRADGRVAWPSPRNAGAAMFDSAKRRPTRMAALRLAMSPSHTISENASEQALASITQNGVQTGGAR